MDEAEARRAAERRPDWTCRTSEIAELTEHTEGWPAGLYLAALSIRARGAQGQGRGDVLRERPARVRLPEVGVARAPVPRTISLPHAYRRSRADVRAALRRGPRAERLRGDSGVARALEPVRGTAGRPRGVVPLPPPFPGAAACGAGASRAGSRSARCSLVQPTGARRTGSPRRPSATPSRPATSTGWHGWSSVAPSPPTRAAVSRPPSAGSTGWSARGARAATRRSPCSAG